MSRAFNHAFKYGSIVGSLTLGLKFLIFFLDISPESFFNVVPNALVIGGMIWTATHYRDKFLGGVASFGSIFGQAIIVGVLVAIFNAVFLVLLVYRLDLLVIDRFIDEYVRAMQEMPEISDIYTHEKILHMHRVLFVPLRFLGEVLWTVIFALLIAVVFRRKSRKSFNEK